MSGFKLLAIVPLKDCDTKFRKNLSIGTPYKFLDNVTLELNKDNSKIIKVAINNQNTIEDLYNLKNGIKVEISAVVGLNGSGKSTLIELLYYFIYAISIHNDKEKLLQEHSEMIQDKINYQRNDTNKIYSASKKTTSLDLLKISKNHDLTFYKKDFEGITSSQTLIKNALRKRSEYLHEIIKNDKENEDLIKEKLAVSLVYETYNGIHSISFLNGRVKYYKYNSNGTPEIVNNFFFDPFFYSICLNYSHHSLNSKVIGNWINSLFHKNDGYITPVVINPMREEGNFNINRELHLSNERVMSNLTYDVVNNPEVSLLKKYELKKFLFTVKKDFTLIKCIGFQDINAELKESITKNYEKNEFDNLKSVRLVRSILGNDSLMNYTNYLDYALGYLENKIDKIKNNYSQLFNDINGNFSNSKFMYFLRKNESHITKKLRQTINFIDKTNNNKSIWNKTNNYDYEEFSIDQFKSWLSECNANYQNLSPSALMNFALPGFFNIDFEIITKDKTNIKLSDLSSGEQQMIFNINTITYHLYNLQSIHADKEDKNNEEGENINRLKYKNVSIILDEVEIYYHPEMQRELTFNLLNTLENIKGKEENGLESIHIIYLTHSPFILSDIPSSNTLLLDEGKIVIKDDFKTFGANIYDLLADSFFLKGFTGKFAELKINNTVEWLFNLYNKHNDNNLISEEFPSSDLITKHKQIIDLIDEPILKRKLLEIYSIVFSKESEKERQIKEITKMAESLGLKVTKIIDQ
ncbi:hypothetical protein [Flavobacterium taihuense]|uniref:AAA domain-containing protein n=1 Tax=Flavobacterium taihuense TaxID=2857508 RepID=A0ABS6XWM8_9FLAO|nr:hypothetical protein [Flavobacterium taihuense]MBW4361088.1 hypothetical protein [Flavobacterium taihuense]